MVFVTDIVQKDAFSVAFLTCSVIGYCHTEQMTNRLFHTVGQCP